jgi:hypothetical protein
MSVPDTVSEGSKGDFDYSYYISNNDDVFNIYGSDPDRLWNHFVNYGRLEERLWRFNSKKPEVFENKTISLDDNTLSLDNSVMSLATFNPAGIEEQLVGLTATQTLTNKTITSSTNNVAASSINCGATNVAISSTPPAGSGYVLQSTSGTTAAWVDGVSNTSSVQTGSFTTPSNSSGTNTLATFSNLEQNSNYLCLCNINIKSTSGDINADMRLTFVGLAASDIANDINDISVIDTGIPGGYSRIFTTIKNRTPDGDGNITLVFQFDNGSVPSGNITWEASVTRMALNS